MPVLFVLASCGTDGEITSDEEVTDVAATVTTAASTTVATTSTTEPVTTTASTTSAVPTTTTAPYLYEGSHLAADGWPYTFEVAYEGPDPRESRYGCNETAPPGRTNLIFSVVVTNELTDRSAPGPLLKFRSNLSADLSAVDPMAVDEMSATSIQGLFHSGIEISPQLTSKMCGLGNTLLPDDSPEIPAGGTQKYEVHLGPVPEPIPDGIVLYACLAESCDIPIPL